MRIEKILGWWYIINENNEMYDGGPLGAVSRWHTYDEAKIEYLRLVGKEWSDETQD